MRFALSEEQRGFAGSLSEMLRRADTVAAARLHADVVISPEVDGVGLMDWKRLDAVRELGRRAARSALPELRGLL